MVDYQTLGWVAAVVAVSVSLRYLILPAIFGIRQFRRDRERAKVDPEFREFFNRAYPRRKV